MAAGARLRPDTPMEGNAQLQVRLRGRVQGVGFRYFTRRLARARGLAGWVRNEADGSVQAVAEGPRDDLEAFLEQLRQGPPGSHVQGATVAWAPATGAFADFETRY